MIGVVYALLGLLAVTTTGLITFALLERKANREQLAMRDLYDTLDEQFDDLEADRNAIKAALDTKANELAAEHELRVAAEKQRDDANQRARTRVVQFLMKTGVADAIRIVDDLLSADGVPEEVPAGDPTRTDDDLLRPAGLQPPR